jgi:hypothetical protein
LEERPRRGILNADLFDIIQRSSKFRPRLALE